MITSAITYPLSFGCGHLYSSNLPAWLLYFSSVVDRGLSHVAVPPIGEGVKGDASTSLAVVSCQLCSAVRKVRFDLIILQVLDWRSINVQIFISFSDCETWVLSP